MKKIIVILLMTFATVELNAQLSIVPSTDPAQLVNNFILYGVSASNVTYTGDTSTLGSFSNGNSTNLGLDQGISMTTGSFFGVDSVASFFCSTDNAQPGDLLLDSIVTPYLTYDASVLEFDLIPAGNILEFEYVFASEEYPEFVNAGFNDVFGFFISGPDTAQGNYVNENIALIPGTNLPVTIDNVNNVSNSQYFTDNENPGGTIFAYDGFTHVLMASVRVVPSETYHLKMAIADVNDGVYDSGIFLKAQSMKSYMTTYSVEETPSLSASVYPNPVTADSRLQYQLKQSGNVVITVKDCTGRCIDVNETGNAQPGNYSYDISKILNACPSGVYFISIQSPDGSMMQKIIK